MVNACPSVRVRFVVMTAVAVYAEIAVMIVIVGPVNVWMANARPSARVRHAVMTAVVAAAVNVAVFSVV